MIPITLAEVCAAVGGELVGDGATVVTGITIDSRSVAPGDLFVAFAGERSDGLQPGDRPGLRPDRHPELPGSSRADAAGPQ